MDLVKYDRKAFDDVKASISDYLTAIGFNKPVYYVPVSAYDSENLVKGPAPTMWNHCELSIPVQIQLPGHVAQHAADYLSAQAQSRMEN